MVQLALKIAEQCRLSRRVTNANCSLNPHAMCTLNRLGCLYLPDGPLYNENRPENWEVNHWHGPSCPGARCCHMSQVDYFKWRLAGKDADRQVAMAAADAVAPAESFPVVDVKSDPFPPINWGDTVGLKKPVVVPDEKSAEDDGLPNVYVVKKIPAAVKAALKVLKKAPKDPTGAEKEACLDACDVIENHGYAKAWKVGNKNAVY